METARTARFKAFLLMFPVHSNTRFVPRQEFLPQKDFSLKSLLQPLLSCRPLQGHAASRNRMIGSPTDMTLLVGWRPSLLGWRPSLLETPFSLLIGMLTRSINLKTLFNQFDMLDSLFGPTSVTDVLIHHGLQHGAGIEAPCRW